MPRKKTADATKKMFRDPTGQQDFIEKSYQEELEAKRRQPVECLGRKFANDDARREYFLAELAKNLKDPKFRKIEGFPIGEDEDILALSDPPYYTACPNPWIADFMAEWNASQPKNGNDEPYHREPFASDVSEGKNDPIYNAHSYHTKVPHKAIMRYILHYTEPGDTVFDGFCGTGMTGVAAQLCGDRDAVMSLGYQVKVDGTILQEEADAAGKKAWKPVSKLGLRRAILNDLSPAASFIAYNYNTPVDVASLEREAKRILKDVKAECGWMYETLHTDGKTKGSINYTVWSDVLVCPNCAREVVYWNAAIDKENGNARDSFECPHCSSMLSKRKATPASSTFLDSALGKPVALTKQVPVLIAYTANKKRFTKEPDAADHTLIRKIDEQTIPYDIPNHRMMFAPDDQVKWGDRWRAGTASFSHVHHLYTKRNLWVLSAFARLSRNSNCLFLVTAIANRSTRMNRIHLKNFFFGGGGWNAGYLKGAIYTPSLPIETSIFEQWEDRLSTVVAAFQRKGKALPQITGTGSSSYKICDAESCDYVFIDPPFGSNLNYSELSFLWESWLRVWTNNQEEILESTYQGKSLSDYRRMMTACFVRAYEYLKPGHWITTEFSNTNAAVWNCIQTSLMDAGFVIANVSALDKKQGSFNAVTNTTSVKQDLVISAYKPNGGFEERFRREAETEAGVWDFVRTHMIYLPVTKEQGGIVQPIPERDPRILFDQMLAYYVRKGYPVPLSSQEFQAGLAQRFIPRDGMYFLSHQAAEYDKFSAKHGRPAQLSLFVSDEASAIEWLRSLLDNKPQTIADITPQFMKELGGWSKHERHLDLRDLLNQNFLCYDGRGPVPEQIHAYLSTNWKEHRNKDKMDIELQGKAKDRWYVPDPNKAGDLEKLRDRALLREFWEYLPEGHKPQVKLDTSGDLPGLVVPQPKVLTGKRIKVLRTEAVRTGFKYCWQNQDYRTIVAVAKRIPEDVLQEDPKLLMWYDQALTRLGEE